MKHQNVAQSPKWSDEFLDRMRKTADPLADAAAASLFDTKDKGHLLRQLREIARNDDDIPDHLPAPLKKFLELDFKDFDDLDEIGEIDEEKLEIAQKLFERLGFRMVAILFFKALPVGYMCPKAAEVLHATKLLDGHAARRVFETAQFLFDVSHPEWRSPEGRGLMSIKKVRLMHAGMRHLILNDREKEWDTEFFGLPINQEDLTLTLQLFSLATVDGVRKTGANITDEQEDAYFYKWKLIGRILGVDQQMEPDSVADGWALQKRILERNISEENEAGSILTKQLLGIIDEITPDILKPRILEKITLYLIEEKEAAKSLNIPDTTAFEKMIDKVLSKLFHSKIWKKLFNYNSGKNPQKGLFTIILSSFIMRRVPGAKNFKDDVKTDFMEFVCKGLVANLQEKAKNKSGKSEFRIKENLVEEWRLNGFQLKPVEDTHAKNYAKDLLDRIWRRFRPKENKEIKDNKAS